MVCFVCPFYNKSSAVAVLRGSAAAGNGSGAAEPGWAPGLRPLHPVPAHRSPLTLTHPGLQPGIPKGCSTVLLLELPRIPEGFELEGT